MIWEHYSHGDIKCACCEEREEMFMTLDHVDGGGRADFQKYPGYGFYLKLIRDNYPDGYRILCMNCNFGRHRNGGMCPHEVTRSSTSSLSS
jgi:hypothetical protein